jgi:NADPH:quinone reductase-like Zn-dependent oxidoreductase
MTTSREPMTAIVQDEYGPAPEDVMRVEEIARPVIGEDEVLVRVRAASVDRGTWHVMAGLPYPIRLAGFGLRRPKYRHPGRNLAGTVEAVGASVTAFAPGDAVFGIGEASFAEYARARPDKLAPKPPKLSLDQAAAVPVSALAALQAVRDHGRVQTGQQVLIVGASGGVGMFAVQIAKAFGAEVTGVCSTAKLDAVRALGADHLVDYSTDDFADGEHRYDVILDIGGNCRLSHLRRALTRRGEARHRRRRERWTLARRRRSSGPRARALPVRQPEARHIRGLGERRGPDGAPRAHRLAAARTCHRPFLSAQRGRCGYPLPTRRARARQTRHHRLTEPPSPSTTGSAAPRSRCQTIARPPRRAAHPEQRCRIEANATASAAPL